MEWHCAACWQQGVLLILLLVAPAVPTSVGFLFVLVGSAYGKMNLMGSCRRVVYFPGSLLASAGLGDTLCWVVPKAEHASESWRRPPLMKTRGQGKTIRSTGDGTQAGVRTFLVFTVFVPQCCVRLRRRPPSWRASLFALPMATS